MKIAVGEKVYTFDPNKFMNVELIAIERATGMNAFEFQDGLNAGSMMAATALIWILDKREGKIQAFDNVLFLAKDLDLSPEDDVEKKESSPESSSDTPSTPAPPETIT